MNGPSGKQYIFIVGAPRSGTTWLHHMVAAHPAVASVKEELTVIKYVSDWDRRYQQEKYHIDQGHWYQGIPLLYHEEEFYNGLRTLAVHAYSRVLDKRPLAACVLDKHPLYALHIPLIHRIFPEAKVLHIIRDGREVAVSMMSAKKRIGFGEGEIKGAAWDWARHVAEARREGGKLGPDRYLELRYEDLMEGTAPCMGTVFDFCGLPTSGEQVQQIAAEYSIENKQVSTGNTDVNALRNTPGAIWKTKLSLRERWTLDRVAGHLLLELGYAKPGWWAASAMDRLRMWPYPWAGRVRNTLGSAKHTWNSQGRSRMQA